MKSMDTKKNSVATQGVCSACGEKGMLTKGDLCFACRKKRHQKRLKNVEKIALGVLIVLGTAFYIFRSKKEDEDVEAQSSQKDAEALRIKYSSDWMQKASLAELNVEREKVHEDFSNPELDCDYRGELEDILYKFDVAIGKKRWEGCEYRGPVHREHGLYLPNDD
jgi:hypothetical protein